MVEAASDSDNGLRALLRKVQGGERKENEPHAVAACVIIAGTNDLAYYTSPDEITDAVLALHAVAHAEGVRTISVDIPESAAALMQARPEYFPLPLYAHVSHMPLNMH